MSLRPLPRLLVIDHDDHGTVTLLRVGDGQDGPVVHQANIQTEGVPNPSAGWERSRVADAGPDLLRRRQAILARHPPVLVEPGVHARREQLTLLLQHLRGDPRQGPGHLAHASTVPTASPAPTPRGTSGSGCQRSSARPAVTPRPWQRADPGRPHALGVLRLGPVRTIRRPASSTGATRRRSPRRQAARSTRRPAHHRRGTRPGGPRPASSPGATADGGRSHRTESRISAA